MGKLLRANAECAKMNDWVFPVPKAPEKVNYPILYAVNILTIIRFPGLGYNYSMRIGAPGATFPTWACTRA
jgi:hypothetical protein